MGMGMAMAYLTYPLLMGDVFIHVNKRVLVSLGVATDFVFMRWSPNSKYDIRPNSYVTKWLVQNTKITSHKISKVLVMTKVQVII